MLPTRAQFRDHFRMIKRPGSEIFREMRPETWLEREREQGAIRRQEVRATGRVPLPGVPEQNGQDKTTHPPAFLQTVLCPHGGGARPMDDVRRSRLTLTASPVWLLRCARC